MAAVFACNRSHRLWGITALALLALSLGLVAATADWANPRAELWTQAREGVEGYSAVRGLESGELIQASGEIWRRWRNGPLARAGEVLLGGVVTVLLLFYWIHGSQRLAKPRTGIRVPRWSLGERVLHWTTALLFILLAVTGLSLLYGRSLLIPLVGHEAFAIYLAGAKFLHNLIGPLFIVCLVCMGLSWFRDNLWRRIDWEWLRSFGGMIGGRHSPAGRLNAGEKAWFWLLMVIGGVTSVTGLLLDLPLFGLGREVMQLSHVLHVTAAFIVLAASLGHIYIGSIGTEGALEGMLHGSVDLSWMRQHHGLWLNELEATERLQIVRGDTGVKRPETFFRPQA